MNVYLLTAILLLLTGSLRLSADPAVIAELAKYDTIFTAVCVKAEGGPICLVDRVLKGHVDPVVMWYFINFTRRHIPVGTRCLIATTMPRGEEFRVFFTVDETIRYGIEGHTKVAKLKDIIEALDETPKIKPPDKPPDNNPPLIIPAR